MFEVRAGMNEAVMSWCSRNFVSLSLHVEVRRSDRSRLVGRGVMGLFPVYGEVSISQGGGLGLVEEDNRVMVSMILSMLFCSGVLTRPLARFVL